MIRRESDAIRHDGVEAEMTSPAGGASASATSGPLDVFLSYNRRDSGPAEHIANSLRSAGLSVFFDRWTLNAGEAWTSALEGALNSAAAVVVLLGPSGMGDWQRAESDLALDRQRRGERVRVVPVLLRGADPPLGFLRLHSWVDLSGGYDDRSLLDHLATVVRDGSAGTTPALCPYRGLRPFRQEDAAFFFGRDEFVARVAASVRSHPVSAVAGASGSGKSSAVYAGLLPLLRDDPAHDWRFVTLRPGREPFHSLAANIDNARRPIAPESERLAEARSLGDAMQSGTVSIRDALSALLDGNARLLLFVDQWEELYTVCDDAGIRAGFVDSLLAASGDRIATLFTVRADYFDDVLEHRGLADAIQKSIVNIGPMTASELRSCIEGPAGKVGLSFEDGLVETILADVAGEAGSLPLLEFVLTELWERRRGDWLVAQAYAAIGGLRGAIADRAEDVLASFGPDGEDRERVKRVMLDLVSVNTGGETRRRASRAEIGEDAWRVVPALADARLLVTSHDDATGDETAEVAHEALIRHWGRLRDWLNEDREFLLWHQRLRAAVETYQASNADDGTLLRGALLAEAVKWRDARRHRLPERELAFITASTKRAQRLRMRRIVNAAFLLFITTALAYGAVRFRSVRQRNIEMRDSGILDAAAAERDPLVAALLIAELDAERVPPAGARIARQIADRPIPMASFGDARDDMLGTMITPDGRHIILAYASGAVIRWSTDGRTREQLVPDGEGLRDVRMDRDGALLALVSEAGTARVLNLRDGVDLRLWGSSPPGEIALARFTPTQILVATYGGEVTMSNLRGGADGERVASTNGPLVDVLPNARGDRIIMVADSLVEVIALQPDGAPARTMLRGHRQRIASSAMDAAGAFLVTGSYDGEVRLWNVGGATSRVLRRADGNAIWSVALDSAGKRFAIGSADGRACDGAVADTTGALICHAHDDEATMVRLSADGELLLSATRDATVLVRRTGRSSGLKHLAGHRRPITEVSFSRDGRYIATASSDGEVRVWSRHLRSDPVEFDAVEGAAAVAGTDRHVALAGYDGAIRVIDMETREMSEYSVAGSPSAVTIRADGRIAVGGTQGVLHVLDATSGAVHRLDGHRAYITSVAFDPSGTHIVTTSADSTVRVWSGDGFRDAQVLTGHTDLVNGAVFSPDDERLVTFSEDGTARIWSANLSDADVLPHASHVRHAAFSPDGGRVVTGTEDGMVGIWTSHGDSVQALRGHESAVSFVTFDAQGRRVASASTDLTARVWPLDGPGLPTILRGHRKHVRSARFSPDGTMLVTASLDSTARVHRLGQAGDAIALHHGSELRDAIFLDGADRVVTLGEDGRARIWRVSWASLHEYLTRATSACLTVSQRVRFLNETDQAASDAYRSCIDAESTSQEGES